MRDNVSTFFHRSLLDQHGISAGLLVVESTELTTTQDANGVWEPMEEKELSKDIKELDMETNRYLPNEDKETHGSLKPKTIILTERQIDEINELVSEFRKGHIQVSFSAFIRMAIDQGLEQAVAKLASYGGAL